MVPERRIENARVRRIHGQIARATRCVHALEQQRPRLAAIARAIDASVASALPSVTLRGDVHEIRICRMYADGRDLLGGLEAGARPGLAGVRAAIDAVPVRRRLSSHRVLA